MWKYMLLINMILPTNPKKEIFGHGQKMFSSVVMYKHINHPNSPNSSLPLMESCFQSTKLIILTPSAQSPTSKPPDFHK